MGPDFGVWEGAKQFAVGFASELEDGRLGKDEGGDVEEWKSGFFVVDFVSKLCMLL